MCTYNLQPLQPNESHERRVRSLNRTSEFLKPSADNLIISEVTSNREAAERFLEDGTATVYLHRISK